MFETQLKNIVIKYIKKEYSHAWIYKTADRWTSGIPDIFLCIDGRFYAIELKAGRNNPTKLQQYVLNKIRSAGGHAEVCRSVEDVKIFLEGGGK